MKLSIKESINLNDYKYKFNKFGYDIYSKMENGKAVYVAVKDGEEPFEITYDQVRGFEPINPMDRKLQHGVKKALKMESVYTDAGFNSRKDYLKSLADDYGVDYNTVVELAYALGPEEDFDALVSEVEDLADDYSGVDNPWELEKYLKTAKYVVYDEQSDESHFYVAPFDNFKDAGYNVAKNITAYDSSVWLYTTSNHIRTYYDANKLDTSNLIVGRFDVDDCEPCDYIDYSFYDNEDDVIANIRDILYMCETDREKY